VLAAVVVGTLLRLVWATWVTADPSEPFSDTAQHLSVADQFSRFQGYRLNGHDTAYHSVGYPLLLAPVALLSRLTGWFSLVWGAALVNVAAAGATIALGARLADRWVGGRAAAVTAWLLALAAGPIYLTSVPLSETVHTAVVLAVLLALTAVLQARTLPTNRVVVGLGLLIGAAAFIRSTGAVLGIVGVLVLWRLAGSWRTAARPALVLALTAGAVLVPWTVRNGLEVGVWAPSSNSAAYFCHGHREGADAAEVDMTDAEISACFLGTPYGPNPDEAQWYRETTREALSWALEHPGEELRLIAEKTAVLFASDRQAVGDAADFGNRRLADEGTVRLLGDLADGWLRITLLLGALALALSGAVRRAWPLWATVLGLVAFAWGGSVVDRYHHTIMAVVAVFASATLVRMGRWASAGVGLVAGDPTEGTTDEPPPPPADEGLAIAAARTGSRWSGWGDHAVEPVLLAVATGAWASSIVFDAISIPADTAFVYARGGWLLTGIGIAFGLATAIVALLDLLAVPRGTIAFRVGVRRLVALDVAIVAFTASFLIRHRTDFLYHDATPTLAIIATILGGLALAVVHWLGGTLTYGYGLRVALDEDRRKGFEPSDDT
jgi:uncharacterized membrane protein